MGPIDYSMEKILFVTTQQYGYHTGTYKHCEILGKKYKFYFVCWDYGEKRIQNKNIDITYVSRKGNRFNRTFRLILTARKKIITTNPDVIIVKKYIRCGSLLKILLPRKKFVFDIRTGSISNSKFKRSLYNTMLRFESQFYNYITVISESLREKLKISKKKSYILPLGADKISNIYKSFNNMNLIYVGTFTKRRIQDTINGLHKFYNEFKNIINIHYSIIGYGYHNEISDMKKLVEDLELKDVITITGYIHYKELKQYFKNSNIGISYIPITEFFDVQPPTKTFEYLLSGMPVIATATSENKKVINKYNGVIIKDNPESFYDGLKQIYFKLKSFNSNVIVKKSEKYQWEIIINNFNEYLKNIMHLE